MKKVRRRASKRPAGRSLHLSSSAAANVPPNLFFAFVSAPCFVSEQLKKYFAGLLFVFIFHKRWKEGVGEREREKKRRGKRGGSWGRKGKGCCRRL